MRGVRPLQVVMVTLVLVSGVSNGTLSLNASTGEVTYDPDDDFNGSDSFTFTVDDGTTDVPLVSTTATVDITVNAVNDVPTTTINAQETSEETDITVDLSGSDVDIDQWSNPNVHGDQ